jgi:hypothetical protein
MMSPGASGLCIACNRSNARSCFLSTTRSLKLPGFIVGGARTRMENFSTRSRIHSLALMPFQSMRGVKETIIWHNLCLLSWHPSYQWIEGQQHCCQYNWYQAWTVSWLVRPKCSLWEGGTRQWLNYLWRPQYNWFLRYYWLLPVIWLWTYAS